MTANPNADVSRVSAGSAAGITATPHVVIASIDSSVVQSLVDALSDHCRVSMATHIDEVIQHLVVGPRPVVITTEQLRDGDATTLQTSLAARDLHIGDGIRTICMLVTDRSRSELASAQLDGFFYVMSPAFEPSSSLALVHRAAVMSRAPDQTDAEDLSHTHARITADIITYTRRLAAESSLRGASRVAVDIIGDLLGTVRAYCLYHDQESGALWSENTLYTEAATDDASAMRGLVGYVAKTLRSVAVPRLSEDPRFDRAIDDPSAVGDERGLFHPIVGADGVAHVILVAIRGAKSPPFDDKTRRTIFELGTYWTPVFESHARQLEVQAALEDPDIADSPFRQEALDAYNEPKEQGEVIRVNPDWIGYVYWGLLAVRVTAIIVSLIVKIGRYANGRAVIMFEGATAVAARTSGVISTVHVKPGERVAAGQLLLSFEAQQERQELRRLDSAYNVAAANWLENPTIKETSAQLARARADRRTAAERLAEREIRAPRAGILGGLRVESGRPVAAGDVLLSIADQSSDPVVLAFLPGDHRPHLKRNLVARIKLVGEKYPRQNVSLEYVSDHVMTPADLARLVGAGIVETLQIAKPMVLARARLPSREITVRDKTVVIHSGMEAKVQVKTGEDTLFRTILQIEALF